VLYLFYPNGQQYQKDKPIRALKKILSRFECTKYIIYINNAAGSDFLQKISENEFEISGDNSHMEFSGWQKGIDFSKKNNLPCDAYLFVNDMFLHDSFFHRRLVNQAVLECALDHQAMVGSQRRLPVSGKIMGNDIIPYVRTHLFIISKKIVDALGSLISIDRQSMERFFIPYYDPAIYLFRENAPISQNVKDFIFFYLTSTWYRKKPYKPQNFEILRNKALSLLNAFLLSIRVRQLDYPLISYSKTKFFLSQAFSADQINQVWFKESENNSRAPAELVNKFWLKKTPPYRHLPKKKPSFTWENFKNLLERYPSFDHL
jgi:hypothetical protein